MIAQATLPIMFDFSPSNGDPDLPSAVTGTTAIGSLGPTRCRRACGSRRPSELGPSPAGGAATGTASFDMVAQTKAFDPAVTSPATDLWQGAVGLVGDLNLVTVQPGQTATIPVTITPSGPKGTS